LDDVLNEYHKKENREMRKGKAAGLFEKATKS
jgi:hypothetical protein